MDMGYSPRGHKELDTAEQLTHNTHIHFDWLLLLDSASYASEWIALSSWFSLKIHV